MKPGEPNFSLSTYKYGQSGALPQAVVSITGYGSFAYDANGNQTSALINKNQRTTTYTTYSKPLTITTSDATVSFAYNADHDIAMRVDTNKDQTTTSLYMGDYELETVQNGTKTTTEQKHYIGPHTIYIQSSDGSKNTYETLEDALGSLTDITDTNGNVIQHFYYSAFGQQKQTKGTVLTDPITHEGFSGHEEIESMNLVHTGGRLYDPVIGRFLSADPTLQMPDNTQNLNRYSYCMNNPLHFIDYNGFGMFDWVGDAVSDVCSFIGDAAEAIGSFVGDFCSNLFSLQGIENVAIMASGAFIPGSVPFACAAVTAINGGNFSDVLRSAALAYVNETAWELTGTGLEAEDASLPTAIAVHGAVGGTLNMLEGGSFEDGFVAAASGEAIQGAFEPLGLTGSKNSEIFERSVICGIVGGAAASVTGGDFTAGFTSAAFGQMFNEDSKNTGYMTAAASWFKDAWNTFAAHFDFSPEAIQGNLNVILLAVCGPEEAAVEEGAMAVEEAVNDVGSILTEHSQQRMLERGISKSDINATMKNTPFDYYHNGEWKTGYYDSTTKIFVGQSNTGNITTVINNVKPSYIDNLKKVQP